MVFSDLDRRYYKCRRRGVWGGGGAITLIWSKFLIRVKINVEFGQIELVKFLHGLLVKMCSSLKLENIPLESTNYFNHFPTELDVAPW